MVSAAGAVTVVLQNSRPVSVSCCSVVGCGFVSGTKRRVTLTQLGAPVPQSWRGSSRRRHSRSTLPSCSLGNPPCGLQAPRARGPSHEPTLFSVTSLLPPFRNLGLDKRVFAGKASLRVVAAASPNLELQFLSPGGLATQATPVLQCEIKGSSCIGGVFRELFAARGPWQHGRDAGYSSTSPDVCRETCTSQAVIRHLPSHLARHKPCSLGAAANLGPELSEHGQSQLCSLLLLSYAESKRPTGASAFPVSMA